MNFTRFTHFRICRSPAVKTAVYVGEFVKQQFVTSPRAYKLATMTVLTKPSLTIKKIPLIDESHCDEVRITLFSFMCKIVFMFFLMFRKIRLYLTCSCLFHDWNGI